MAEKNIPSEDNKIINPKMKHVKGQQEVETVDWFFELGSKVTKYIYDNKKKVLIICLSFVFILAGILFTNYMIKKSHLKTSDQFYSATSDFAQKVQKIESDKLNTGKLLDKDVTNAVEGYSQLTKANGTEAVLSMFNLGVIYYSIQNFDAASGYFKDIYDKNKDFPFSYIALHNLGTSLINSAYYKQSKKEYQKAIDTYQAAIKTFDTQEQKFPKSPNLPTAFRMIGISWEYIAECQLLLNQKDKTKTSFENSIKSYKKAIEYFKKFQFLTEADHALQSFTDKINLSIRRVEVKLNLLNKS